jgi:mannose-6-phosphate isomerase-like protein (cupin superfamily)
MAFPGAKAPGVNRLRQVSGRGKALSGAAKGGFGRGKPAIAGFRRLRRANAVCDDRKSGREKRRVAKRRLAKLCGRASMGKKQGREVVMRRSVWALPALLCVTIATGAQAQGKINPTDPQPTCPMCPGTYIPVSELEAYTSKALAEKLLDQQVRDIDIGKANIGIGMVHRGKLDKPNPDSVAEHDQISEVYHVLSGAATLVLGPDIVNRQRRPATMRTVVEFNGPGNNGSEVRDGIAYEIKAGDVVVIPAGTGHWFTKIEDHIDYLMVRIDPDKVTPLKSEAQSKDYLSKPAKKGE